jgi:hypothetical protein
MKLIVEGTETQIKVYQYVMERATKYLAKGIMPTIKIENDDTEV